MNKQSVVNQNQTKKGERVDCVFIRWLIKPNNNQSTTQTITTLSVVYFPAFTFNSPSLMCTFEHEMQFWKGNKGGIIGSLAHTTYIPVLIKHKNKTKRKSCDD